MNHVGTPAQFLHRLEHTARVENGALHVVRIFLIILIKHHLTLVEVVIVVNEIHLHTGRLNRSHLDNQWMVRIINDNIHTRQTNHLVQLVAALVDISPAGHKRANLVATLLYGLRNGASR